MNPEGKEMGEAPFLNWEEMTGLLRVPEVRSLLSGSGERLDSRIAGKVR